MQHSSTSIDMRLGIEQDTTVQLVNKAETGVASSDYPLAGSHLYQDSSLSYYTYSAKHYYSTAAGSQTDAASGNFSLLRIPK